MPTSTRTAAPRDPLDSVRPLFECMLSRVLAVDPDALGSAYEGLLAQRFRRRSGAHYTPRALAEAVVERALGPLLEQEGTVDSEQILALKVCDPTVGTGAFLLAAGRSLATSLVRAWKREDAPEDRASDPMALALDKVVHSCLFGVDRDPAAVTVARWSLALLAGRSEANDEALCHSVVEGDTLSALHEASPSGVFAWKRAWPEVFDREAPGFDALICNPPFLGGKRVRTEFGAAFYEQLCARHPELPGSVDLCIHFLRLADQLLCRKGFFGFILPRAAAEGLSREFGLAWLLSRGFTLTDAHSHVAWPGAGAGVVVCTVHGTRKPRNQPVRLDGHPVRSISSFLRDEDEPLPVQRLQVNAGIVFGGCKLDGRGFVLEPAEARTLIDANPRNAERIRPFLGGEELNALPDLGYRRLVIDFGRRSREEAEGWPDLFSRVEATVRLQRKSHGEARARDLWWQFQRSRPALEQALAGLERCLVCSMVSTSLLFAFQPVDRVFSHKLAVFATGSWAAFAVLQSRAHEAWTRRFASSRGQALNYAPTTCFLTFPFPWRGGLREARSPGNDPLARAGRLFYEHRLAAMGLFSEGMAATWKRMLEPSVRHPEITRLRVLRDEMDAAVLEAFGWRDLEPGDEAVVARLRRLNVERASAEAAEPGRTDQRDAAGPSNSPLRG